MMELVFLVEEDIDGGLTARPMGEGIFTEADDMEELRENIRDAVLCHFDDPKTRPRMIRLHVTRDEVLSL